MSSCFTSQTVDRRLVAWIAVSLVACGGTAPRVVRFRDAANARELRLSATGTMAAIVVGVGVGDEVRLRQRVPDNRQVASGVGTIVGLPSERDVLVVDGDRIAWLRARREAALGLPRDVTWRFLGGSVDHTSNTATLAFVPVENEAGNVRLVEIATAALRVRATLDLAATKLDSCRASGNGSTLYVWCLELAGEAERWRISRHDGAKTVWATTIEMPHAVGQTDVRGAVTGDGSVLVLVQGDKATSELHFNARRMMFIDARDHRSRAMKTSEPLYLVDELVPVPGRPEVAYRKSAYGDFDGIVVVDARAETLRIAVPRDATLAPLVFAAQSDGTFVIP